MGQEFQLPASFQGKKMSPAFQQALGAGDSLAEGIGQSYSVLGYKGKVWSLRHRGQRYNILRPDDGTPSSYLDVIILQSAPTKSKSYYKKYEPGSSDGERPICASIDGVVPDLDVQQKQHDVCSLCPRNVWKTDPQTGRKGRECTDYKRLAVLILPTQTKPILGEPLLEPVFLRVPPASLNALAMMGEQMEGQGFHYSSFVTRITFDPNKSWPEMVFRPIQSLTDQELPLIIKLRNEPLAGRITGGEIALAGTRAVENALAAPGTVTTGLAALGTSDQTEQGGVLQGTAQHQQPNQTAASSQQAGAQRATPPSGQQTSIAPPPLDTGLGGSLSTGAPDVSMNAGLEGLGTNSEQERASGPSDAGEPEESDADLDARIASLIGKG